jgi:crossover junction endodeoxyribonuclease RuvC
MINNKTYVGIDPGFNNTAISIFKNNTLISTNLFNFSQEEDKEDFINLLKTLPKDSIINLEKVHSMPKQGVSSTFKFGVGFGIIQGALLSLSLDFNLITPQFWKKKFLLIGEKKECSIEKTLEIYPNFPLTKNKQKNTNLCDSFLICISH